MITVHLYYTGEGGNARNFAQEMEETGIAEAIRNEPGNLGYRYFQPLDDPETVLLIDSWKDQEAIRAHGATEHFTRILPQLAALCEERLPVEQYITVE